MKKILIKILLLIFSILMIVSVTACDFETNSRLPEQVSTLEMSDDNIYVNIFDKYQLYAYGVEGQAVWSSSDDAIATVDSNGLVTAVKEGAVTVTATIGEYVASCAVLVLAGENVPSIVLSDIEVPLFKDSSYTLGCEIQYLDEKYQNGEFTFKSLDESIATVDSKGKITGVGFGETKIEVSANWKSFVNSVYLKEVVTVFVKHNIVLQINEDSLLMSQYDINAYGKNYLSQKQINYVAKCDENIIANNDITWVSSDDEVVSFSNGIVNANKIGNSQLQLLYTLDGITYESNSVNVVVEKPLIDITHKSAIILDKSENQIISERLNKIFDFNKSNDGGKEITKIIDEKSNKEISYDTVSKVIDKSNLIDGERVFIISNDSYDVRVNVTVATKVIKTEQEFIDLQTYGDLIAVSNSGLQMEIADLKEKASNEGYFTYSGYFILGNDLDFTGVNYGEYNTLFRYCTTMGDASYQNSKAGFKGVFDGQGYTVKNILLDYCGLFGTISEEGIVKNLNVEANLFPWANGKNMARSSNVIAQNLFGTLENVNITVNQNGNYNSSSVATMAKNATLKNVTVNTTGCVWNSSYKPVSFIYWIVSKITLENVFVNADEGSKYTNAGDLNYLNEHINVITKNEPVDLIENDIKWDV